MTDIYFDELIQCPECKAHVRARRMRPAPEPATDSSWLAIGIGAISGATVVLMAYGLAGLLCL